MQIYLSLDFYAFQCIFLLLHIICLLYIGLHDVGWFSVFKMCFRYIKWFSVLMGLPFSIHVVTTLNVSRSFDKYLTGAKIPTKILVAMWAPQMLILVAHIKFL